MKITDCKSDSVKERRTLAGNGNEEKPVKRMMKRRKGRLRSHDMRNCEEEGGKGQ